jgi:hypothetical protein
VQENNGFQRFLEQHKAGKKPSEPWATPIEGARRIRPSVTARAAEQPNNTLHGKYKTVSDRPSHTLCANTTMIISKQNEAENRAEST